MPYKNRLKRLEYAKEYRKIHKGKWKIYYRKNRQKALGWMKKYRETHKKELAEKRKIYGKLNREKVLVQKRNFYIRHRKKLLEQKRKYAKLNRKKINIWRRKKRQTDINFRLACDIRGRLNRVMKDNRKGVSAVRDLGCTIPELKIHLEKQFQPGMTWNNWSRNGWHIDHIIQFTYFDLTDSEQVKKVCHYTNLQPLWAKKNLSKNKKRVFYESIKTKQ